MGPSPAWKPGKIREQAWASVLLGRQMLQSDRSDRLQPSRAGNSWKQQKIFIARQNISQQPVGLAFQAMSIIVSSIAKPCQAQRPPQCHYPSTTASPGTRKIYGVLTMRKASGQSGCWLVATLPFLTTHRLFNATAFEWLADFLLLQILWMSSHLRAQSPPLASALFNWARNFPILKFSPAFFPAWRGCPMDRHPCHISRPDDWVVATWRIPATLFEIHYSLSSGLYHKGDRTKSSSWGVVCSKGHEAVLSHHPQPEPGLNPTKFETIAAQFSNPPTGSSWIGGALFFIPSTSAGFKPCSRSLTNDAGVPPISDWPLSSLRKPPLELANFLFFLFFSQWFRFGITEVVNIDQLFRTPRLKTPAVPSYSFANDVVMCFCRPSSFIASLIPSLKSHGRVGGGGGDISVCTLLGRIKFAFALKQLPALSSARIQILLVSII
ncbi:uncharacterized protein BDCG_01947 [Blastomyces dermatitidis ER-3]|uniref:Uncharacterized protein n=1 Tax=Ajellomyces dermatitidis (strain ER-3 / ATCC MYA-2586) TaxID=559297 RepID=A0ABM9YGP5_AJEDR|nr:uncharacterized protein BDCG_01947 [Blastomyces dermatitidis ER-3]EEQ86827.2 hypothetical protein BDCG_01947 [Blastomyces dermatitidis ER-3]